MLNYAIHKFDRALAFQVTAQSSKYTNALDNGSFIASNGWTITKGKCPELNVKSKTIYLRGTDANSDLRVDRTWDLSSNYVRDNIVSEATHALEEFRVGVNWSLMNPGVVLDFVGYVGGTPEIASKPESGKNVAKGKVVTA